MKGTGNTQARGQTQMTPAARSCAEGKGSNQGKLPGEGGTGPAGREDSSKSLVQKLKGRIQAENLKIVSSEENKIQEVQYLPLCHSDRQMDRGTTDTTSSYSRMPVSSRSCLLVLEASSSFPPQPEPTVRPQTPVTSTGQDGPLATTRLPVLTLRGRGPLEGVDGGTCGLRVLSPQEFPAQLRVGDRSSRPSAEALL